MRIIISPAKKMKVDTDSLPYHDLPEFLADTQQLCRKLQSMSCQELKTLWKCNDQIAALNVRRLQDMDIFRCLTPAVLAYEGIQYQYMAPGVFTDQEYAYLQDNLRILSGFYGILRPFDGVTPYRLEMQAKLSVDWKKDLYEFWDGKLAAQLAAETDVVLNLASKEYSKAVEPHLPPSVRFLTCTFGELKDGRVVEKGTQCKMARGQMVRWLAENSVTDPGNIRDFADLGYRFSPTHSTENNAVFIKEKTRNDHGGAAVF